MTSASAWTRRDTQGAPPADPVVMATPKILPAKAPSPKAQREGTYLKVPVILPSGSEASGLFDPVDGKHIFFRMGKRWRKVEARYGALTTGIDLRPAAGGGRVFSFEGATVAESELTYTHTWGSKRADIENLLGRIKKVRLSPKLDLIVQGRMLMAQRDCEEQLREKRGR